MTTVSPLLAGRPGRLFALRLKPNEDLVSGLQKAVSELGLNAAYIRSGVGSLNDAHFDCGGQHVLVEGPGLEILTLTGEIDLNDPNGPAVKVMGSVSNRAGQVSGGQFRPHENAICITAEIILQEWCPDPPV